MKICHISDTHGTFPKLPNCDVVVHSGDMLPNKTRGDRHVEKKYQLNWIHHHSKHFRNWIGDRPFLFCSGNHDFAINPEEILKYVGVNATCLDNRLVEFAGLKWYGFPWVPAFTNEWNWEVEHDIMGRELRKLQDELPFDVLVAHAPLYGVLDYNYGGQHIGNRGLANMLTYEGIAGLRLMLHGHAHESPGEAEVCGVRVSNAATVVRTIDVSVVVSDTDV